MSLDVKESPVSWTPRRPSRTLTRTNKLGSRLQLVGLAVSCWQVRRLGGPGPLINDVRAGYAKAFDKRFPPNFHEIAVSNSLFNCIQMAMNRCFRSV